MKLKFYQINPTGSLEMVYPYENLRCNQISKSDYIEKYPHSGNVVGGFLDGDKVLVCAGQPERLSGGDYAIRLHTLEGSYMSISFPTLERVVEYWEKTAIPPIITSYQAAYDAGAVQTEN